MIRRITVKDLLFASSKISVLILMNTETANKDSDLSNMTYVQQTMIFSPSLEITDRILS